MFEEQIAKLNGASKAGKAVNIHLMICQKLCHLTKASGTIFHKYNILFYHNNFSSFL